jgi:hypothetical protein
VRILVPTVRRRYVEETFCYRRSSLKEMFCQGDVVCIDVLYGDVLSRTRFLCAPIYGTHLVPVLNKRCVERKTLITIKVNVLRRSF